MSENGRDPYLGLLNTMRAEAEALAPVYLCLGTVLEITETTLRAQADGHELDQEDLLINDMLRVDFEEEAEVEIQAENTDIQGQFLGMATCGLGVHSSFDIYSMASGHIKAKERYKVQYRLAAGDLVLLIPSPDRQTYYLVMKVVRHGAVSSDRPA